VDQASPSPHGAHILTVMEESARPPAYAWDWFARQRLLWRNVRKRLAVGGHPSAGRYRTAETKSDVMALIRRDKTAVTSYIEKNFNVSAANAMESYEDISGVIVDGMMMRDEPIQRYLDSSHRRGELSKRLSVSDMFDFTLLRSLQ
jgi:hypothetical protein